MLLEFFNKINKLLYASALEPVGRNILDRMEDCIFNN